jgi:membrane protein YqaA with SNARE-associated domain
MIRWLDRLVPWENPGGAVYGTITLGALLAAESGLRDTYLETVGSAVVTLVIYWLAHSYAELVGERIVDRTHLTARGLGRALARDRTIVQSAGIPVVALLACWAAGASQEDAVTVALWVCAGCLLAFEVLAGVRTRARPAELLLEVGVGLAMGVGVLALRVILH